MSSTRVLQTTSTRICAAFVFATICCGVAPQALSQVPGPAPIRVESDDVLVPVWVFDKPKYQGLFHVDQKGLLGDLMTGNFRPWENVYVQGLTASDFRLFEDNSEQKIRSVVVHAPHIVRISDNFGEHYEFTGSGGGRWTFPDRPTPYEALNFDVLMHWPSYIIAYDPPPSRGGDCHQVAVRVTRPDSLVYVQPRYCQNTLDPADPLAGTNLDRQMETDLAKNKRGKIPLLLAVFPSLSTAATHRVDIVLEFPWQELAFTFTGHMLYETVGVLGSITSSNGKQVAHFSDVEGHNYRDDVTTDILMGSGTAVGSPAAILNMPRRYDKQVYLEPGQYTLQIVLTDGKNFGRADAAFTVDPTASQILAVGGITLARRFRSAELGRMDSAPAAGAPAALVSQGIESTPTADNRFRKDSTLHCYFDLYEPDATRPVKATLRISNAKSGGVAKELGTIEAAPYVLPGSPIISMARPVDTRGLPKGEYLLKVQATDSNGMTTPWRSVPFSIR
jgi:hypothetical protein